MRGFCVTAIDQGNDMSSTRTFHATFLSFCLLLCCALGGCGPVDDGKIPVTTDSKEALESYRAGLALADRLRGQEAIRHFQAAVAQDRDFALAYLGLAFALPTAGEFFKTFDKALGLADGVSEGERLWIKGVEAIVNGYPTKQQEYFRKLTELYPRDERAFNLLGNSYFGQQDYQQAIAAFRRAAELAPDFSQPYNQLGYAYRYLDDYPAAEAAFTRYIELIPDDPNPYDSYAELLLKMGRFDESIAQYRMALTHDAHFVASHVGIATCLTLKDEHQAAREHLDVLLELARNDGERRAAHFARTVTYVDEGAHDTALEEQLKQYALARKTHDSALEELKLANRQNPYNHYRLGLAQEGKGNTAEARTHYETAAGFNALNSLQYAFIRKAAAGAAGRNR